MKCGIIVHRIGGKEKDVDNDVVDSKIICAGLKTRNNELCTMYYDQFD